MKIGDVEVPDGALEEAIKKLGKRVVDDKDYLSKSEAAGDLAKFRAVTGENRSVEDIGKIIKAYEENERKNKTEAELMKGEVDRLKAELSKLGKEAEAAKFEVRKGQVNKYFDAAMEKLAVRVIEPILQEFRDPFYTVDESKLPQVELEKQVGEAITKAVEKQKNELARLGLGSPAEQTNQQALFSGMVVTPPKGDTVKDVYDMMGKTSASPMRIPFSDAFKQK